MSGGSHIGEHMKKLLILLLMSLTLAGVVLAGYEDTWGSLLKKHTAVGIKNNVELILVNYQGIKADPRWPKLLTELQKATPLSSVAAITTATPIPTKNKELAFWINAYNIGAVKMMVDNVPLKSIKDKSSWFSSVWDQPIINVGGKEYALGHIEHKILRQMHEPQIHASIVCASVSCPDLRQEAYRSATLYKQLDSQLRQFLSNPKKGVRIDKKNKTIYLSAIFKWFQDDFDNVRATLAKYLPNDKKELLDESYQIQYLNYDWSSNSLDHDLHD